MPDIWRLRQTLLRHIHYIILSVSVKREIESPISNSRIKVVCCSMVNTESKSAFSLMFLAVLTKKHNSIFFRLTQNFFCDILKDLLFIFEMFCKRHFQICQKFDRNIIINYIERKFTFPAFMFSKFSSTHFIQRLSESS